MQLRRRRPASRATRPGTSSRDAQRDWVIDGSPNWKGNWNKQWYGIKRFFEYLEIEGVQDAHPRAAVEVPQLHAVPDLRRRAPEDSRRCCGASARKEDADAVLAPAKRFLPVGVDWSREQLEALPGLCLHDLMLLPIDRLRRFFDGARRCRATPARRRAEAAARRDPHAPAATSCDVGIGYLTLDRQSRTLSGGEVQRINLTTALGTSLVNTLFVLDEPSIGLHPRDMNRIIEAMQRLRDAGNTLVVVEHDPAVMLAADRLIDMGPGPGERGGRIVFDGTPDAITQRRHADRRLPRRAQARRHGHQARSSTEATPRLIARRRARPQPEERHGRVPAAAPGLRHRRLGLGQEHADAGRAVPGAAAPLRQGDRDAGRARRAARRRPARRRGVRRPVRRSARPRAPTRRATSARSTRSARSSRTTPLARAARLRRRHVQLQRRRRPLPDLRRLGLRARRDAVPLRRLPALPRLRRPALPRRDPRREDRPPPARRR